MTTGMNSTAQGQGKPEILMRYELAERRRRRWDPVLREAYRLTLPEFEVDATDRRNWARAERPLGQEVRSQIFDSTGADALDEKAARVHGQLFPPFQEWMALQDPMPGTSQVDVDEVQETSDARQSIVEKFHRAIDTSNFHTEIAPALREAHISLGCLNVNFGTPENPLSFEAVPVSRVTLEEAFDGIPRTVFLTMPVRLRELKLRYPNARLSPSTREMIEKTPDETVEVLEANIWSPEGRDGGQGGHIHWSVWTLQDQQMILEDRLDTERTIAFRVDKAPGEVMGRGPVLKALPEIKTANKIVELVLKNASIAVTGIWQAEDDGVLNPANIRLVPGAIIPKATGSKGLTPLEAPGRFDISQLLLKDLQNRIRMAIKGPELPPADETARTAFELGERRADQRSIEAPQTLQLMNELYDRLARRCFYILSHHSMAGSPYYIASGPGGNDAYDLVPTSPLVRVQEETNATGGVAGLVDLAGLVGIEAISSVVNVPDLLRWWLRKSGLPDYLILRNNEGAEMRSPPVENVGQTEILPEEGPNGGAA